MTSSCLFYSVLLSLDLLLPWMNVIQAQIHFYIWTSLFYFTFLLILGCPLPKCHKRCLVLHALLVPTRHGDRDVSLTHLQFHHQTGSYLPVQSSSQSSLGVVTVVTKPVCQKIIFKLHFVKAVLIPPHNLSDCSLSRIIFFDTAIP